MTGLAPIRRAYTFGDLSPRQAARLERALPRPVVPALLPVPDVMQRTDYTCGPASLRAVLALYGIHATEAELARAARTSPATGTEPEDLARVARSYGLEATVRTGMTILDLKHAVLEGTAVIVNYQAWREPSSRTPWRESWDDGHFAVVIGVDDRYVYLEDPWSLGRRERIRRDEFLDRWHGGGGRDFLQGGVVVKPAS